MAKRGALERPWVRVQLIRELASGEHAQSELARRYDCAPQSISEFAGRHAERIAEVARDLNDQFAGLWAASKAKRIDAYQQQIEHIAHLLDPDEDTDAALIDAEDRKLDVEVEQGKDRIRRAGVNVSTAELMRTQAAALRAIADELGQIPARMQVEHSGRLDVVVNGVDLGAIS
jgi:hypothetical protein